MGGQAPNPEINTVVLSTAREYIEGHKVTQLFEYMLTSMIIDRPADVREYIKGLSLPPDDDIQQAILDMKISPEAKKLQMKLTKKFKAPRSLKSADVLPPISKPGSRVTSASTQDTAREPHVPSLEAKKATFAQDGADAKETRTEEVADRKGLTDSPTKWGVARKAAGKLVTAALVKRWVDHGPENGHHGDSHADSSSNRLSRRKPQNQGVSNGDVLEAMLYNRHSKKRVRRHHSNLTGLSLPSRSVHVLDDCDEMSVVVPKLADNPEDFENQSDSMLLHGTHTHSMVSVRAQGITPTPQDIKQVALEQKTAHVAMKMRSRRDVVGNISIFNHCTSDFLDQLASHVHVRRFRFHDRICTKGTAACCMYYIAHGAVEVVTDDGEQALADLEEGNHFGEGAILNHQKRTATVRAATNTILMCISKDDLDKVIEQFPENKDILDNEARKLRDFEAKLKGSDRLLGEFEESFLAEVLKTIPIFKDCNTNFLHDLALTVELKHVAKGTCVINKGDLGHEMFFIVRGTANVVGEDKSVVGTLEGGHFFGEIGVLFECPRTFTVVAETSCDLVVLEKDRLEKVVVDYPDVKDSIRREATERYEMYKRLHNNTIMFGTGMDLDIVREGLGRLPVFNGCEQLFLHALALVMKPYVFKHNEILYKHGDEVDKIIYLVDGTVEAIDADGDTIQEFDSHTLLGIENLVLATNMSCTYKAACFGYGMAASREEVERVLEEYMDDFCLVQEHAELG